jgi:phosphomannomutase
LSKQEIEAYFADQLLSFGTAGVRGKMGLGTQRMNRFTYTQLAYAYAKYISVTYPQNLQVVIGHDNRIDSKRFAKLCANVMSSFNIRVLLFAHNRLMPTPIVSYAIRRTNSSGGIIITASHNPKEYNGFKAYNPDGGQILPDVVESIVAYMAPVHKLLEITYQSKRGMIGYLKHSIVKQYFHDARAALINLSIINEKKEYPIVFTGHHGTACLLGPQFLKQLKFNIKPVRAQSFYSSTFVNSPNANPETLDSFTAAIDYAEKINSELCIGVDPDGDRMAVVIKKNNE